MKYLVDSDYVADYLGARPHAIQLLSSFAKDDLSISLITYGEIYEGIHFGRDPQKTKEVFHLLLRSVAILPLSQPIMRQFARIRGELRRTGKIIGDFDILIVRRDTRTYIPQQLGKNLKGGSGATHLTWN